MELERIEITPPSRLRRSITEIRQRLGLGRDAVYHLLQSGKIPSIRGGDGSGRLIVTRHAFEEWERACGTPKLKPSKGD